MLFNYQSSGNFTIKSATSSAEINNFSAKRRYQSVRIQSTSSKSAQLTSKVPILHHCPFVRSIVRFQPYKRLCLLSGITSFIRTAEKC
jgi:hypothetical protein